MHIHTLNLSDISDIFYAILIVQNVKISIVAIVLLTEQINL